ncbi:transposase [Salinibius halmophilus]|uniref:transposase n=1 Tax=Salinibius halmophilus TaxID=1853216 RepID=UPI000E66EB4D|nr:transposase [Salinibius halmophilus]
MTVARCEQILLTQTLFYHCICRCVRQAFLCGIDQHSQRSYDHRRLWIVNRIRALTEVFCINVAAYSVMSNHYHIVLFVDTERAKNLSNEQVVAQWYKLFKANPTVDRYLAGDESVKENAMAIIATWRARITDVSWFMKCLNEYIAKKANAEDGCKGRFWDGRFKSQPLLDERALLAAMAYVDLNPVHADMADTLESSEFTSIYERLFGRACSFDQPYSPTQLMPFQCSHPNAKLPFTMANYLDFIIQYGGVERPDKRGFLKTSEQTSQLMKQFERGQWQSVCIELAHESNRPLGSRNQIISYQKARGRSRCHSGHNISYAFG